MKDMGAVMARAMELSEGRAEAASSPHWPRRLPMKATGSRHRKLKC